MNTIFVEYHYTIKLYINKCRVKHRTQHIYLVAVGTWHERALQLIHAITTTMHPNMRYLGLAILVGTLVLSTAQHSLRSLTKTIGDAREDAPVATMMAVLTPPRRYDDHDVICRYYPA